MCCFAKPVRSVTNTNIFARLTRRGTQMLAYQMQFESDELNAMTLPIPVGHQPSDDSVRFISLKGYDNFFADLNRGFPNRMPSEPASRFGAKLKSIDSKLVVHEVGDFIASFVPTMNDFSRLDQRFVIPKSSWDKIPMYNDYGFAVFQLKKHKGKTHPMAMEFETRHQDRIFFPTVHIHDGEVHKREHFDHSLYLQNDLFDAKVADFVSGGISDRNTGLERSNKVAKEFCRVGKSAGMLLPDLLVHRQQMRGTLKNSDVFIPLDAAKNRPANFGAFQSLTPFLLGMMGLGWLVKRRNTIGRQIR